MRSSFLVLCLVSCEPGFTGLNKCEESTQFIFGVGSAAVAIVHGNLNI